MNLSPYQLALIAGGFTIIGVLLGAWIGFRNALKLYSITEFNKAAMKFRNAFLPEIIYLKHGAVLPNVTRSSDNIRTLLSSAYLRRHLKAYEAFLSHIPAKDRRGIEKAWNEYRFPKGLPSDRNEIAEFAFNDYMSFEEVDGKDSAKKVVLEKINNILKFAKNK